MSPIMTPHQLILSGEKASICNVETGSLDGRDENVSKNGRRQRRQRRRSTSTSRKAQSGRRRPVENLSQLLI